MIDVLIALSLLMYIVLGFRDGFFKKLFGIIGFWGGLICATKFFPAFGDVLRGWLDFSKDTSYVLAFLLIFLVISILLNLFYRWFGQSGSNTIKVTSRIAGAIMGGGQGAVAISLFLLMLNIFDQPSKDDKKNSMLYKQVLNFAPLVFDYSMTWVPESKAFLDELKASFGQLHISE